MQRRTLIKGIFGALFLPLVRTPRKPAAQTLLQDLVYSDSENTADLSALKDGDRQAGGVVYGA